MVYAFYALMSCLVIFFAAPVLSDMAVQTIKHIRRAYDKIKPRE